MEMVDIYQRAWYAFHSEIKTKTRWSQKELVYLMARCLIGASSRNESGEQWDKPEVKE